ncbi:hypothetical protein PAMA_001932 [Pampus argenteus]
MAIQEEEEEASSRSHVRPAQDRSTSPRGWLLDEEVEDLGWSPILLPQRQDSTYSQQGSPQGQRTEEKGSTPKQDQAKPLTASSPPQPTPKISTSSTQTNSIRTGPIKPPTTLTKPPCTKKQHTYEEDRQTLTDLLQSSQKPTTPTPPKPKRVTWGQLPTKDKPETPTQDLPVSPIPYSIRKKLTSTSPRTPIVETTAQIHHRVHQPQQSPESHPSNNFNVNKYSNVSVHISDTIFSLSPTIDTGAEGNNGLEQLTPTNQALMMTGSRKVYLDHNRTHSEPDNNTRLPPPEHTLHSPSPLGTHSPITSDQFSSPTVVAPSSFPSSLTQEEIPASSPPMSPLPRPHSDTLTAIPPAPQDSPSPNQDLGTTPTTLQPGHHSPPIEQQQNPPTAISPTIPLISTLNKITTTIETLLTAEQIIHTHSNTSTNITSNTASTSQATIAYTKPLPISRTRQRIGDSLSPIPELSDEEEFPPLPAPRKTTVLSLGQRTTLSEHITNYNKQQQTRTPLLPTPTQPQRPDQTPPSAHRLPVYKIPPRTQTRTGPIIPRPQPPGQTQLPPLAQLPPNPHFTSPITMETRQTPPGPQTSTPQTTRQLKMTDSTNHRRPELSPIKNTTTTTTSATTVTSPPNNRKILTQAQIHRPPDQLNTTPDLHSISLTTHSNSNVSILISELISPLCPSPAGGADSGAGATPQRAPPEQKEEGNNMMKGNCKAKHIGTKSHSEPSSQLSSGAPAVSRAYPDLSPPANRENSTLASLAPARSNTPSAPAQVSETTPHKELVQGLVPDPNPHPKQGLHPNPAPYPKQGLHPNPDPYPKQGLHPNPDPHPNPNPNPHHLPNPKPNPNTPIPSPNPHPPPLGPDPTKLQDPATDLKRKGNNCKDPPGQNITHPQAEQIIHTHSNTSTNITSNTASTSQATIAYTKPLPISRTRQRIGDSLSPIPELSDEEEFPPLPAPRKTTVLSLGQRTTLSEHITNYNKQQQTRTPLLPTPTQPQRPDQTPPSAHRLPVYKIPPRTQTRTGPIIPRPQPPGQTQLPPLAQLPPNPHFTSPITMETRQTPPGPQTSTPQTTRQLKMTDSTNHRRPELSPIKNTTTTTTSATTVTSPPNNRKILTQAQIHRPPDQLNTTPDLHSISLTTHSNSNVSILISELISPLCPSPAGGADSGAGATPQRAPPEQKEEGNNMMKGNCKAKHIGTKSHSEPSSQLSSGAPAVSRAYPDLSPPANRETEEKGSTPKQDQAKPLTASSPPQPTPKISTSSTQTNSIRTGPIKPPTTLTKPPCTKKQHTYEEDRQTLTDLLQSSQKPTTPTPPKPKRVTWGQLPTKDKPETPTQDLPVSPIPYSIRKKLTSTSPRTPIVETTAQIHHRVHQPQQSPESHPSNNFNVNKYSNVSVHISDTIFSLSPTIDTGAEGNNGLEQLTPTNQALMMTGSRKVYLDHNRTHSEPDNNTRLPPPEHTLHSPSPLGTHSPITSDQFSSPTVVAPSSFPSSLTQEEIPASSPPMSPLPRPHSDTLTAIPPAPQDSPSPNQDLGTTPTTLQPGHHSPPIEQQQNPPTAISPTIPLISTLNKITTTRPREGRPSHRLPKHQSPYFYETTGQRPTYASVVRGRGRQGGYPQHHHYVEHGYSLMKDNTIRNCCNQAEYT